MNTYRHIADVMRAVHDALMAWGRGLLRQADLEVVEVYGQFPPQGTVTSHMVLFPYWVGPTPKLLETGHGISVTHPAPHLSDGAVKFIPEGWLDLGQSLAEVLGRFYPAGTPPQVGSKRIPYPHPPIDTLPAPLKKWYEQQQADAKDPWVTIINGQTYARPPALTWMPGFTLTVRYIAVASDPGRGTSQQTSVSAPLALPALSVLATGVHKERHLIVSLPPAPLPPNLEAYVNAILDSLGEEETEPLRSQFERLKKFEQNIVALLPVQDLSNHEFALLMQALQRPLQAALNVQIRLTLGARPEFKPSTLPVVPTKAPPRGSPRGRLGEKTGRGGSD